MNTLFEKLYVRYQQEPNLCENLRRMLREQPEGVKEKLQTAERAREGMHILCGTMGKPFFVGKPPCWHENRVGDEEYVVGLNRMYHWNDWIVAYAMTGKVCYAEQLIAELKDWIEKCPCPPVEGNMDEILEYYRQATPWRTLEVGLRMDNTWNNAFRFLMQENMMEEELFDAFTECIRNHAKVLMTIPPLLWPDANHNHYLSENLGLFYAAYMLRELPETEKWIKCAESALERCVQNQLTDDGGQIEGCPLYHNVSIHDFCRWLIAAEKCGVNVPDWCRERVWKALDYSVHSLRPTGKGVPWGDSDPDEQAVQSAVLGYLTFGSKKWITAVNQIISKEDMKRISANYCFTTVDADLDMLLQETEAVDMSRYSWQHTLQQVMMRTAWNKDALSVFFACRVPCQNGHGHIDPAGFDFCANGKALLVDAGRYCYREEEMRRIFKSAKMHNTLTIGNKEPFSYETTWTFSGEKDGCILNYMEDTRFMAAHAMHTSYFPIIHERLLALVEQSFLLVWDRLSHMSGEAPVEIWYHMNTESAYLHEDGTIRSRDSENMCIRSSENLTPVFFEGMISDVLDVTRPSTRLCLRDVSTEGRMRDYLTIVVPFKKEAVSVSEVVFENGGKEAVFTVNDKGYRCHWENDTFEILSC